MSILKIHRLKCNNTTSGYGKDDAYIEIDGEPFWGGDDTEIDDKQTLTVGKEWEFESHAQVIVYDWDEGDHDKIGGFSVSQKTHKNSELSTKMNGDGSDYEIFYSIY